MIIGGLQKNSLIDYPGKVSCVIFLSGCNFDCPYCHNPDLAMGRSPAERGVFLEESKVFDYLKTHKGFLDGVVISGGEPTLQKGLVPFCEKIKNMGYFLKLDTNGSKPSIIKKLIDKGLVDYIAMDIKTSLPHYKCLTKDSCNLRDITSSIGIIMESAIDYEFRTTCIKSLIDEQAIKNISFMIKDSNLYALQKFNPAKRGAEVLHPELFQDNSNIFDDNELLHFKLIAESMVKKCIVR